MTSLVRNCSPSHWLMVKDRTLQLVDKDQARKSLTCFEKVKHFFGMGPYGLYTIRANIFQETAKKVKEFSQLPNFQIDSFHSLPLNEKKKIHALYEMGDPKRDATITLERLDEKFFKKGLLQWIVHVINSLFRGIFAVPHTLKSDLILP